MSPLERRYRRLLAAYPTEHRAAYGEEMLGVLVQSAPPDRHRPSGRDVAVLLRHAAGAHLKAIRPALVAPDWARAGAIFGIVAALVLAVRDVIAVAVSAPDPYYTEAGRLVTLGQAALWAAAGIAVATARLRRWPVAALVVVATVAEVVTLTWWPPLDVFHTPAQSVGRLAVAVTTGAALVVGIRADRVPRPAGWIALAVLIALPSAEPLLPVTRLSYRYPLPLEGGLRPTLATLLVLAVAVPLGLVLRAGVARPVRRRLLAVAVALLAEAAFLFHTTDWHTDSSYTWYRGAGLVHWPDRLGAVAIPLVAFLLATVWVARGDRIARSTPGDNEAPAVTA